MSLLNNTPHQVSALLLLHWDAVRPRLIRALCGFSSTTGSGEVADEPSFLDMASPYPLTRNKNLPDKDLKCFRHKGEPSAGVNVGEKKEVLEVNPTPVLRRDEEKLTLG